MQNSRVREIVNRINSINSTHEKIVAHQHGEMVANVIKNPKHLIYSEDPRVMGQSVLAITAWDGDGHSKTPEGFESRYGAPVVGITSHPEAIAGTSAGANFQDDANYWSANVFADYAQSMQTYATKRQLIETIKKQGIIRKAQYDNDEKVGRSSVVKAQRLTKNDVMSIIKGKPHTFSIWLRAFS